MLHISVSAHEWLSLSDESQFWEKHSGLVPCEIDSVDITVTTWLHSILHNTGPENLRLIRQADMHAQESK